MLVLGCTLQAPDNHRPFLYLLGIEEDGHRSLNPT